MKEATDSRGQFEDRIGTGGDRMRTGTTTFDRYFTLTVGSKQMGVVPIRDRLGTHIVDQIAITFDAANSRNNHTVLNGHPGPTDVE